MHSDRMHTARLLTVARGDVRGRGHVWQGGVHGQGGHAWWRGVEGGMHGGCAWQGEWGGVPYDLSHHAFDVTRMLSLYQLRGSTNAAAYILLVGHVTFARPIACWDASPPITDEKWQLLPETLKKKS